MASRQCLLWSILHAADDAPGTMTPLEVVPSTPTTQTLHSVINLIILVDAVNSLRKLVVAISETWLEYYTDLQPPRDEQQ